MMRLNFSHVATVLSLSLLLATADAAVLIQELVYDGVGTDSDEVFTELVGTPGMSLDGWSLVGINGGSGLVYKTIDLSTQFIPADGIFVIATDAANAGLSLARDYVANVDWQNGPDAIQLLSGTSIVDALQYGDADMFNAGEGGYAADVAAGMSLSRDLFATDSDDNFADFSAMLPTPGAGPSVVPVPAAVWLFGSGLGLLGFRRRHTDKKPA
jgi:hypothetical protein